MWLVTNTASITKYVEYYKTGNNTTESFKFTCVVQGRLVFNFIAIRLDKTRL